MSLIFQDEWASAFIKHEKFDPITLTKVESYKL